MNKTFPLVIGQIIDLYDETGKLAMQLQVTAAGLRELGHSLGWDDLDEQQGVILTQVLTAQAMEGS